jgi:SulP family sulfate permease
MPDPQPSSDGALSKRLTPEAPARRSSWEVLGRYVPAFASLRHYSRHALAADAMAGITVAAVAVPQAMAYAQVAGIPPQYGLYTAIVVAAVGSLFTSSRQLIDGPTNALSIAILSSLAFLPRDEKLPAVFVLALLMGLMQIGLRILRLGDLTRFISHGVIVGFTVGAGLLLVMDQLKNLLGLQAQGGEQDHFVTRFALTIWYGHIHWPTAVLSLATVGLLLGLPWLKRTLLARLRLPIPEFLLTVIILAAVVWAGGLARSQTNLDGVSVVGRIPREEALPALQVPPLDWLRVRQLAGSALAIAVLGLLEAVAMAKSIALYTGRKLDINQLCLSEGLANVTGSFFQCMPGSGSLTRSAINQHAGAVSQWAGVISAGAVALMVLLLAPLAYYIPRAALAGILVVTAWRMVDRKQLLYHLRATRFDAGIVLATAFAAVAISVEFCILIGVFLSFVLYVPRAARVDFTELTVTPERIIRERAATDPECSRILLYNLEGELLFATAPEMEKNLAAIAERTRQGARVIVLRVKRARNPDAVCLLLLEHFVKQMQAANKVVLLCGVRPDLARALRASGLDALLGPRQIFHEGPVLISSTLEAVRRAYELLGNDLCDICPRRQKAENADPWYFMI